MANWIIDIMLYNVKNCILFIAKVTNMVNWKALCKYGLKLDNSTIAIGASHV